jgi:O-antigen/teichoic acid export membrane protein
MKTFAKAFGVFTSGAFMGIISQILKGKIAAIYLGTAGVGVFSQLNMAWSFLFTLTSFGFHNGIIRRIASANNQSDEATILKHIYTVVIFLSTISIFVSVVAIAFSAELSNFLLSDNGENSLLVSIIILSIPFAVIARVYQSILNSFRVVKPFVYAQVVTDLISVIVFWLLVVKYNITGAVISMLVFHILRSLLFKYVIAKKLTQSYSCFPDYKRFSWGEVKYNMSYGVSGLLLASIGIATVLIISRWIIAQYGLESNGVFSIAWKVSSIYLAALSASAGGYYFPTLSSCVNNRELTIKINEAITLYMYVIPVLIAILIVGGEFIIELLFSKDFVYASVLLLFLLPGDFFRVISETAGLSLLAKGKVISYSVSYILWASMFLLLSYILLPLYGIMSVALSYLISHILQCIIVMMLVRKNFSFKFSRRTILSIYRSASLIMSSLTIAITVTNIYLKAILLIMSMYAWLFFSLKDKRFNDVFYLFINKLLVRNV